MYTLPDTVREGLTFRGRGVLCCFVSCASSSPATESEVPPLSISSGSTFLISFVTEMKGIISFFVLCTRLTRKKFRYIMRSRIAIRFIPSGDLGNLMKECEETWITVCYLLYGTVLITVSWHNLIIVHL